MSFRIICVVGLMATSCSTCNGADPTRTGYKTVKDYGAQGDGTNNDAPAIQATLDKEDFVFLPPGTYRLSSRLTISRSGVSFVGAGPSSTVLLVDESLRGGCLSVIGPSVVDDVEIRGFKIDGSKDPAKLIGLQIQNSRRVRLSELTALNLSGLVHLEAVDNFQIRDISGSNLIEFISMNSIKRGTISDIRVTGVDEGFDFFNCEDVEVTNAILSAREPTVIQPNEWAVAVDLSSSRRISISNCDFSGHHYSIKVKHDTEKVRGRPPVEDILISDCQLRNYKSAGIFFQVVEGRSCRVQSCEIHSTLVGTTGIYGFLPKNSQLSDLVIADCSIDSTVHGIRLNRYAGIEILDCRIRSKDSHGIHLQSCELPIITSCRIHSPGDAAILLDDVEQPVVSSCHIAGVAGIWATNCGRPVLRANVIPSALGRGITVEWVADRGSDVLSRMAGFVIDENIISGWGGASIGNPAIALSFPRTPSKSYSSGNEQAGISVDKGGLELLDWLKLDNNLASGTYVLMRGEDSLGPNCTRFNNSHRKNLP